MKELLRIVAARDGIGYLRKPHSDTSQELGEHAMVMPHHHHRAHNDESSFYRISPPR